MGNCFAIYKLATILTRSPGRVSLGSLAVLTSLVGDGLKLCARVS